MPTATATQYKKVTEKITVRRLAEYIAEVLSNRRRLEDLILDVTNEDDLVKIQKLLTTIPFAVVEASIEDLREAAQLIDKNGNVRPLKG